MVDQSAQTAHSPDGQDTRSRQFRYLLIRGVSSNVLLRVSSVGLQFLAGLLLARLLGAAGFGRYIYAVSWMLLLAVPAIFGIDRLVIRELSRYQATGNYSAMRGIVRWANLTVFTFAIIVVLTALALTFLIPVARDPQSVVVLRWALLLIPLFTLLALQRGTIEGLHRVVLAHIPETVVQPALLLMLILIAWLWLGSSFTAQTAILATMIAMAGALVIAVGLLKQLTPPAVSTAPPMYQPTNWLRLALPLVLLGGMHLLNVRLDVVMLGILRGSAPAGIYAIASRAAEFVLFILIAVDTVIGPSITRLHTHGHHDQLQHLLTRTARTAAIVAAVVAGLLVAAGPWILAIFGPEFPQGRHALTILTVGQFINVASGSTALLLIMTGRQNAALRSLTISTVVNVILNGVLIPPLGIEGAALATAASTLCWNGLMIHAAWRHLKLNPTCIGPNR